MTTYKIHNVISGHFFGEYEGETPSQALEEMARDAGYDSLEEAQSVGGKAIW